MSRGSRPRSGKRPSSSRLPPRKARTAGLRKIRSILTSTIVETRRRLRAVRKRKVWLMNSSKKSRPYHEIIRLYGAKAPISKRSQLSSGSINKHSRKKSKNAVGPNSSKSILMPRTAPARPRSASGSRPKSSRPATSHGTAKRERPRSGTSRGITPVETMAHRQPDILRLGYDSTSSIKSSNYSLRSGTPGSNYSLRSYTPGSNYSLRSGTQDSDFSLRSCLRQPDVTSSLPQTSKKKRVKVRVSAKVTKVRSTSTRSRKQRKSPISNLDVKTKYALHSVPEKLDLRVKSNRLVRSRKMAPRNVKSRYGLRAVPSRLDIRLGPSVARKDVVFHRK